MDEDLCFRCNERADKIHDVVTEGARVVVPLCIPCHQYTGGLVEVAVQVRFADGVVSAHGPSGEPAIRSFDTRPSAAPRKPALLN